MTTPFQRDCIETLIDRARQGAVDRRAFISAMGLLASLPLTLRTGVSWAEDKHLVVVNWGGDAIEAYQKAFADGFTRETGIAVKIDGSGPTEGAIKTQHESGNVSWDVVDADAFTAANLGKQGIIDPIDYTVVDKAKVRPGMAYEYGVAGYLFSYVIAYDSAVYGDDGPKNWVDFWDVKAYPDMRTMYKWMTGVLEAALLADGVEPAALYPLDVERAYARIEQLKPYVLSFWGTGAESQQLLLDGEVAMGMIWNTRAMRISEDTDNRVRWSFDNGFLNPSSWAVIKGNPAGKQAAMQYIAYAQQPQAQVTLFDLLGNGPANPAADTLIPDDKKALNCASPENAARQVRIDMEWYADHYAGSLEKFLTLISN